MLFYLCSAPSIRDALFLLEIGAGWLHLVFYGYLQRVCHERVVECEDTDAHFYNAVCRNHTVF